MKESKLNEKIDKSKEIIKKEKEKIRSEKRKLKEEKKDNVKKQKKRTIFHKLFFIKKEEENKPITLKEQIFSMLYFEAIGFILCLLVLFALSGGKNFIKLYKELNKLINVYDTITSDYYGELDKEILIDNAIQSMLSSVEDNYTTYSDQDAANSFLENIEGTYEGIGCSVSNDKDGNIYVVEVFEDGPASKSGLKENDIILKIDDKDYLGKTSEDMSNYVKESENEKIKLTIKRDDQEHEITIVREKVEVPSVQNKIIEQNNKKIGYIDISIFSSVTTTQFETQLKKLEKNGIKGLIIDVRNDTGGYLSTVTDIANLFLKKGQIIYQLEDKKIEKIKDTTKEKRTYPVAVLVNAGSASASEILAAAIKESYNGYVVGTNTFGKGTVQKTKKLSDGSMIKYTVQKWLTPNGTWINQTGLEPTHAVGQNMNTTDDNQLSAALDLIDNDIK